VGETYAELSARVRTSRRASGIEDAHTEEGREDKWILPAIGVMQVIEIRPHHINAVLDHARAMGLRQETLSRIRSVMSNRFDVAWREETIAENPVLRVSVPKTHRDNRERAVLTDDELAVYLAWVPPEKHEQEAVLERQTMACVSRMLGGSRAGDLHGWTWKMFDVEDERFAFAWVPRKKTKRPQRLAVPEMLRPKLLAWWVRHGKPTSGLVFPALRGKHAGKGPKCTKHASALRRDLARAFGLERLEASVKMRSNDRRLTVHRWVRVRELTARERELFEESEFTRPVDFHSFRRAFSQGLAEAGVNAQTAQALTGHSSLDVHERYLRNTAAVRTIPEAALPKLPDLSPHRPTNRPEASSGWQDAGAPPPPHGRKDPGSIGVSDGVRTRDHWSHSPVLCH
jgi:integrase